MEAQLCVYNDPALATLWAYATEKNKLNISMEKSIRLEKPDHCANIAVVEEKKVKLISGDDEDEIVLVEINKEGDVNHVMHVQQEENIRKRPSSTVKKDLSHEDQLRSTKAKIGEVKEENERLKQLLTKAVKNYQSLQKHVCKIFQEEEAKKTTKITTIRQENQEPELVSLSLGRSSSSSEPKKEEKKSSNLSYSNEDDDLNNNKGLSLGLDCKFEPDSSLKIDNASSENSFDEEPKEEETTETWSPSKVLKTTGVDDEVLQPSQIKKARVSVRARCDTPTMNDGCQWRKYGQKISKGNPCPRAYYRCTVSPTCPVRKQVQRCAKDMSVLITTYEGTHNHPLSNSATAMASTTSAAVSMLQSRSSTSQGTSSISAPASISTTPNGLNFTLSQNSRPQQFYFPNSSISTSTSHPTITLDLTTTAPSSTTTQYLNRFSSVPTSLNFSSSSSSSLWNPSSYSNYGTLPLNRNNNHQFYQPYMQVTNNSHNQESFTESIAVATKMLASNPNLIKSALAAAITSFVGNNGGSTANNNNNFGDQHESLRINNGIGCASSYLNNSATKSASESPANSRDQNKG